MITGGIRAVSSVTGPSTSRWLKRRRDGLAAQHRALDEGRIDDLVRLMQDEQSPSGSGDEEARRERSEEADAAAEAAENDEELVREVTRLAADLEARIARVRTRTLDELQDLDRRVEAARFGGGRPPAGGGRRGGHFNGYL